MALSYDQIMSSAKKAHEAGDTESAAALVQMAADAKKEELKGGSKVPVTAGVSPTAKENDITPISQPSLNISSEMAADPFTALKAGVPLRESEAIKVFAKARGIPESNYKLINGQIAYKAKDGKYYAEIPSLTSAPLTSPLSSLAYITPDITEAIPETVTGIATSLGSPAIAIPASGAVSSLSNYVRQKLGQSIVGENARPTDIGSVAVSGLLSGVSEAAPFAYKKFAGRNIAKDISQFNLMGGLESPDVRNLIRKSQDYNIPLTPAEITNLPFLKEQQKVLSKVTPSSETVNKFYEKRLKENVQPAIDDFLGTISRQTEGIEAGAAGQEALFNRVKELKNIRETATSGLYKESFSSGVPINITPVITKIDTMLTKASEGEKRVLNGIKRNLYQDEAMTIPKTDLESLHRVKLEIDPILENPATSGIGRTVQRDIKDLQRGLVNELGTQSPQYGEALKTFAELSKPINEFEKRKAGLSLTKIPQDQLDQFATKLFSNTDPKAIKYTKAQIESTNPQAWKDVSRAWLQKNWEDSMKINKSADGVPLDAGKYWANTLMGDVKKQKVLRAALSDKEFNALRDLTDVLQASGRVAKIDSGTAFNQKVMEDLNNSARGFFSSILQPRQSVINYLDRKAFEDNADVLANIITSPDGIKRLKDLKQLSPTSVKRVAGMAQLFSDYAQKSGTVLMPESINTGNQD